MSACLSFYLLDLLTKEELWYVRFTLQLRLRTSSHFVWPAVVRSSCSRPLHHEGGALMSMDSMSFSVLMVLLLYLSGILDRVVDILYSFCLGIVDGFRGKTNR